MTEYPSDPQPKLDAAVIREALAGYALANEVIEAERQATLAHMTHDEALAIWRDLMKGFDGRPEMHEDLDRLDLWQVEGLVTVRRALDLMAVAGYEDEVMRRAVDVELEQGKAVKICSAEDLIIHKAIAGRPQDVRDIEGIVYRQRGALDVAIIGRWLHAFAELLDNPEIVERFERPWQRIHSRG